jgi:hypothetical protein
MTAMTAPFELMVEAGMDETLLGREGLRGVIPVRHAVFIFDF